MTDSDVIVILRLAGAPARIGTMLSPYDDLLIHQTPFPIETVSTSDPRAFDRFYFNLHDTSGEFVLAFGAGVYPNLDVMDAGVSAVFEGKHWNVRMARELRGADRADTTVGPIRFEVLEGLKSWRIRLDENEHGVSFDVVFRARALPCESPHQLARQGHWVVTDMHHYTQPGRYEGWLQIGSRRWDVHPETFYGHRDRSWGVRMGVGGVVRAGRETIGSAGGGLHLWIPAQFADRCVFVYYQEDAEGRPTHCAGQVLYEDGRVSAPFVRVEHDIRLDRVSRIHQSSTLVAHQADGGKVELECRQLLPGIYLAGMGYGAHGTYHGPLAVA
ncbi:MAG: hypothetical protein IT304_10300, partial [Dehalococcoidia bacterium]|nr:hypothetical protein [Dehalococcoidia bacterium]